jgi:hypothetical protein
MKVSETLSPDGVADLLARLGHPVDRRNIVLALQAEPIAGVVPSPRRGTPWSIAPSALLDVVAAVLRRRAMRAASRSFQPVPPLARYHRPAAELLLRDSDLARVVPKKLRFSIEAAAHLKQEQAEARRKAAAWAAGREQRAAEARERQKMRLLTDYAMLTLYADARMAATAARFRPLDKAALESPAFAQFVIEWPYPGERPADWLPPPGVLEAAIEEVRPFHDGKTRQIPDLRHLFPATLDWSKRWPWWKSDAA